jgi:hypothetical protein
MQAKLQITKMFKRINKMGRDRDMPILTGTTAVAAAAVPVMSRSIPVHAE